MGVLYLLICITVGRTRFTESESVDKRHRTAFMQIMVKQTGHTEKTESSRCDKDLQTTIDRGSKYGTIFHCIQLQGKNGAPD